MVKAQQAVTKAQASFIQMPQNNFNSTQKLRFSQSNKKNSIERASIPTNSKLNILPNATIGQYSTNSTQVLQTGMNSAHQPQLLLNERSLNSTATVPLVRQEIEHGHVHYNGTQLLDRLFNQSSLQSNGPV